jgi:hypothetical protein
MQRPGYFYFLFVCYSSPGTPNPHQISPARPVRHGAKVKPDICEFADPFAQRDVSLRVSRHLCPR